MMGLRVMARDPISWHISRHMVTLEKGFWFYGDGVTKMALMNISNVYKSFGIDDILEDISFLIEEKDRIGLIGLNGAGKSTLLKILAGHMSPDGGNISRVKGCHIGYMAQGAAMEEYNTIADALESTFDEQFLQEAQLRELEENISDPAFYNYEEKLDPLLKRYGVLSEEFKNRGGYEIRSRIRGVMKGLNFEDPKVPIANLSGGQKTRLALGRLLLEAPELLLLDEPTNYLDIDSVEWLEGFMRDYPGAFLVVSHDRFFLDNTVNTIFELSDARISVYGGNYSEYVKKKHTQTLLQKKHDDLEQKEIERLKKNIQTFISHRNYVQARVRERKLAELLPESISQKGEYASMKVRFKSPEAGGKEVLQIENLGFAYEDNQILKDVNLKVYRGERIGMIGPNGIGKSTLLKILAERLVPDEGFVNFGHLVEPVYLAQEQEDLSDNATILDEVWNSSPNLSHTEVRTFLGSLLFSGDDVDKTIGMLSGGEKSRVSLAKAILRGANMLLLDEPTNHLDIVSKEKLEEALLDFEGTIIAVSHDRYFLTKIADRIWEFTDEGIEDIGGGFTYYLEKKAEREKEAEPETIEENKTRQKKAKLLERQELERQREERRRQKDIENSILAKEAEIEETEHLLCKPEIYSDPEKSRQTNERYQLLLTELEDLYDNLK